MEFPLVATFGPHLWGLVGQGVAKMNSDSADRRGAGEKESRSSPELMPVLPLAEMIRMRLRGLVGREVFRMSPDTADRRGTVENNTFLTLARMGVETGDRESLRQGPRIPTEP